VALHLAVILGTGLQLATVFVPGLRLLLGLELPDAYGLAWVAGAVLLSWCVAETYSRFGVATSARLKSDHVGWTHSLAWIRRVIVAVVGSTVLLVGIALLVLPGPAFIVIPLGLGILATEFVWARALLKRARDMFPKENKSKSNPLRPGIT